MITFASVLRYDPENSKRQPVPYNKEWVNKLYRAIQRNFHDSFRFVCLSNTDTDVETIPLITDWPGWWSKIELFRPNLFEGPVVYFDLDVLICKDFTRFFNGFNFRNFHMLLEPTKSLIKPGTPNSSIMYWYGDYSYIWNDCLKDPNLIFQRYWKKNNPVIGDQGYIRDKTQCVYLNDTPLDPYFTWRSHKLCQEIEDPTFVIFAGKDQKPITNLDLPIVRDNWI